MGEGERVAAHGHRIAPGWRAVRLLGLGLALAAGAVGLAACDPPPPPHTFTVNATLDKVDAVPGDGVCQTSTAGQCTLRAAVQEANAVAGDDTIELQAGSTYTLSIGGTGEDAAARGDLDLASNITVHGHGALVDAKSLDHALQVRSGTIAIDQVTVRGANGSGLDVVGGSAALADSTLTADTVGLSTSGSAIVSASRSTISGASTWGVSVAGGQVTLLDSTIGANGSGGVRTTAGTVAATNTVVGEQTSGPGCSTAIASGGWNLDAATGCGFTQSTDLQSTPAGLGPLVPSGGPTPTMRPMVGSAAVDSGQPGCAGTDQRGAPRPVDGDGAGEASCDRGAVEVDAWHPLTMTVTSATDAVDDAPGDGICHAADGSCTLRAAIQESDWSTGPDVVTLAASTTYPIRVTGSSDNDARAGDLDVTSPVTIHGNGSLIVDGLAADGIVQVFSTGVAIDHVELHGTNISSLDVRPRAAVDLSDSSAASSGNGVSTGKGSQVTITRSTLTNNTAGLSNNGGTTVIVDSTVASNSRNVQIAGGSVTATNSIIADPMVDASCSAPITSAGWNLSTDTSCGLAGPTDVTTAYAHLGPYVTTGTRVPSRAPTDGSAAIDTGRPGCTGTDQRGQVRPVDGDGDAVAGCDRGAVEAPTWHPLSFVVDTTTDLPDATPGDGLCVAADGSCTLRSAIQESNAANGPDVIDLGVGRTYGVSSSGVTEDAGAADDLDVTGGLTLHGHGSTIAAYLSAATFQVIGGQLSTDHVTISNNYGIAIDAHAAAVTLVDSTVTGNTTAAVVTAGGAPLSATRSNLGAALSSTGTLGIGVTQTGPGSLTLRSTATGAITSTAGQIDIATSTVGGLVIRGGAATLVDSTIVGQHIGLDVQSGSASVTNSIADHLDTTGWDCFGPVTSGGWNLSSDHSCALSGPADLQDSDPRLSGLRGHGGPTPTRIPLAGSPATDSGKPGCAGDDQRGLPRPADGDGNGIAGCDRGAAELSGWNPLDLTVTSSNDSHDLAAGDGACQAVDGSGCTLRAAIEESNVSTGPDTVTLAVPVAHIDISDPDLGSSSPPVLTLETDVTLHGAGGAVGSGELQLLGSTVAIDHLALPQTENGGADLTISDATLDAYEGLRSWAGTTTIRRSVSSAPVRITGGSATIDASSLAGGLSNKGTGSVEVIRSTIGTAVDWGLSIDDSSTTTVTSSTITGRLRAIDPGWAASTPTTTVTLTDSTIVGGLTGAIGWRGGSATATNTVLTAPAGVAACAPAAGGQLQSGGWNLAEDGSCGLTGPNDVQSVDAGLGLLGNHGGPTPTVLALAGSPVIDAGRPTCGGTDQRGVVRPQDGDGDGTSTCDRGAVESTRYDPLTLVVDATSSEPDAVPGDGLCQTAAPVHCTLLAAIQESNESTGPDTVTLAPGATYVLALPLPANPSVDRVAVTGSLAIHGSGATIQGFGLRVVRGDLSLDELTVSVPLEADASSFTIDRSTSGGLRLENTSHATITNSTLGSAATAIDLESGTVSIDNSTISAGEGLFVRDGSASITNSTVVADSAALHLQSGSVTVGNSILGRSLAPAPDAAACLGAGSFVSQGWNLTWDASCPFTETSDRRSTDPKVGPSAPNGGPTNTRLPLTGSPAIDTGKPGCGPTDQRGLARSVDGDNDAVAGCDRGAAELAPWHPLSLTVNSTADGSDAVPGDGVCATAAPARCTIRAAVQEANASTGPDTVDLASGATYALTRSGAGEDGSATGDLDVSSSLVIHGNGSTLNGGGFDSAIQTFGGSTAIDHLSLTGVAGTDGSAGIDSRSDDLNFSDGTITSGRDGFVDRGTGSVKIYRSTVFAATRSGWNIAGSSVSVTDSTLTGTTSSDLSVGFENDSNGPVALLRSTISGRRIGIVAAGGRISVTTSTIANSTFASIDARRSTVTVVDSTLSENQYGIFRDQGTVSLTNSIISSSIGGTCFGTIGPIVSGGWNLASNANCGLTGTGDVQGVATLLGALANNGGYTLTSLPSATSPALGTGKPGCSGKDQRGTVRPSGGACDKGAVER